MAVSKLTCPECGTVLRPAKPVPEGKRVKCPRCETVFAAGGEEEEAPPPRKKAAPAARKPAPKAAPAKKAAVQEPPKKEEEETYGYVKEPEEEDEEKKPKISYAPDMSVKDLRGPAQSKIMSPSNNLARVGFIGFFGWLAFMLLIIIPAVFPIHEDKPKEVLRIGPGLGAVSRGGGGGMGMGGAGGGGAAKDKVEEDKSTFLQVAQIDFANLCALPAYFFWPAMLPFVFCMLFAAMVSYGAIQMQNIESRPWGIAGSIMAMVPITAGGVILLVCLLLQYILNFILEDEQFVGVIAIVVAALIWLASVGSGVWALVTLNNADVIAGFEYEPE
jgi:predicted Zn finger-like uncharacterized protein